MLMVEGASPRLRAMALSDSKESAMFKTILNITIAYIEDYFQEVRDVVRLRNDVAQYEADSWADYDGSDLSLPPFED